MTPAVARADEPVVAPVEADAAPASAWYALAVLTVVLIFATVDRAILSLLAEPIKRDLGLTDLQLGLVHGTGIAVFTAIAAFPMAWLADRFGRRVVLAGSIVVWSTAVVFCGLAQSFGQILFAAAMVGAGEAGLAPITYALIADLFRGRQRQMANSIFVVAAAAGGGLAMFIAGQLVALGDDVKPLLPPAFGSLEDWRISFFMAAMPAPLMAALVFTIRQIGRARTSAAALARAGAGAADAGSPDAITLREHLRLHWRTLVSFFAGIGFAIFSFAAVGAWLAVILIRNFGQTPAQVGGAMGVISLAAIAIGFVFTVFGLRRLGPRLGRRLPVRTMWVSCLLAVSTSAAMAFATSATHVYVIQFVQAVLLTSANMLFPTALQELAPSHLRGRVVAIQTTTNVALTAAAAPLVGLVSDLLAPRPNGLLIAAAGVAVCGLFVAAFLLRLCEQGYARTVEAIEGEEQARVLRQPPLAGAPS